MTRNELEEAVRDGSKNGPPDLAEAALKLALLAWDAGYAAGREDEAEELAAK